MQPWEDEDNATKGPEIPLQRRITAWILKQLFLAQPDAPTSRMGQIVQLHQTQSIVTVGPIRAVDPRDYSILQTAMLHHDNVDEPRKKHCFTYSIADSRLISLRALCWQRKRVSTDQRPNQEISTIKTATAVASEASSHT